MTVNSERRTADRASFAQFRALKQSRASFHSGYHPATQDILNGAAVTVATAVTATASRMASFSRFQSMKQLRVSICIDDSNPPDFVKFKTMKDHHSPMTPGALGAVRSRREDFNKMLSGQVTRYNLSKLTNRRGEDQDPKEGGHVQFILVEGNLESSSGMQSYSKMAYVINSTVVCAFHVGGDSTDKEPRRWSAQRIAPNTSDDGDYNLIDTSNMPKLKPIYCASRNVRGYEMTFPNMPLFLALFEEENIKRVRAVSL